VFLATFLQWSHLSFRARRKEAWYKLTKEEQDRFFERVKETLTQVGATSVVMCNSGWASDKWEDFGIEEYPNIEAVQKRTELFNAFDLFRYVESEILLGTEME